MSVKVTRIRYKEEPIGQLTSPKLWSINGKWLEVKIDLVKLEYSISDEDSERAVARGTGKTAHHIKATVKNHLKDLGVVFFDELRKKKDHEKTIIGP